MGTVCMLVCNTARLRRHAQSDHLVVIRADMLVALQPVAAYCTPSHLSHTQESMCTLQTFWRRCHAKAAYAQKQRAVLILQSAWRKHAAQQLLRRTTAAKLLQTAWRGFAVRKAQAYRLAAAVTVQTMWRGLSQRRRYRLLHRSAVAIQAAIRR